MTFFPVLPKTPAHTIQLPADLRDLNTLSSSDRTRLKFHFSRPPRRGAFPISIGFIHAWPHRGHTVFQFDSFLLNDPPLTLEQVQPFLDTLTALGWELKQVTEWQVQPNVTARVIEPVFIGKKRFPERGLS